MKITREEVLHVANLARLKLDSGEADKYQRDLNSILEYMEMLSAIDTGNIEPMSHPFPITNVFREDEVVQSQEISEALLNAPEHKDGLIMVPKVIE